MMRVTAILAALACVPFALAGDAEPWVERIREPQYFAVSVQDVDASAAWYRRVFGLHTVDDNRADDDRWRIVNLANDALFVEIIHDERDGGAERGRGFAKVGFRVPSVDAVADRIEQAGEERPRVLEFEAHGVRLLQLRDPDGNIIQLTSAAAAIAAAPSGEHPLSVKVRSEDARRFADVFEAAGGKPTAEQLQAGYLDGAGRGVAIFTPGRIENAENLAAAIAADPDAYRRGIDVCLPLAERATDELRSIYLGLRGVFPEEALPEIHVVFGAGNSGGTAGPGAQVLGLEVICAIADTPEEILRTYRKFFAHETVHVLQDQPGDEVIYQDLLVSFALLEGTPDFVAKLVTGHAPDPQRDAWARGREAELWREFNADRAIVNAAVAEGARYGTLPPDAMAALKRWFANYGSAPEGWPYEAGYWVGRQIAQALFDGAEDKRAVIDRLMAFEDPLAVLKDSGYAP